jgi:hypothetical protein
LSKVVLPAPKKPDKTVTGSFFLDFNDFVFDEFISDIFINRFDYLKAALKQSVISTI